MVGKGVGNATGNDVVIKLCYPGWYISTCRLILMKDNYNRVDKAVDYKIHSTIKLRHENGV